MRTGRQSLFEKPLGKTTVYLPDGLREALRIRCQEQNISQSDFIRLALAHALKNHRIRVGLR
jgi:plasmid stability protein